MGEQVAKRFMTAHEVAEYLDWHVQTVYLKARQGLIPSVKLGANRRFERDKLDAWIESQSTEAA